MNQDKMMEILSDQTFIKSLWAMDTAGEVKEALSEKGIELTEEEILAVRDFIEKVESGEITQEQLDVLMECGEDGVLSEEALKLVSGGAVILTVSIFYMSLIKVLVGTGVACGAIAGTTLGAVDAVKNRW